MLQDTIFFGLLDASSALERSQCSLNLAKMSEYGSNKSPKMFSLRSI